MSTDKIEFYKRSWDKTKRKLANQYLYKARRDQRLQYQQELLQNNPEYAESNRERARNLKFSDPEAYAKKLARDRERLRNKRAQKKAEALALKAQQGII